MNQCSTDIIYSAAPDDRYNCDRATMSTSFLVFPGGRSRLVNPIKLLDARPSKRYGMDVCADLGF